MIKQYKFEAIIKKHETLDAAFVEFPYDVEKEFGKKGQVKVRVKIDKADYQGSLVKMKYHCHFIGITKEIRNKINKNPGDRVNIILQEDIEERTVEIPEEIKNILETDQELKLFFNSLSYTNRKEYVRWITGAKKEETKTARLAKIKEMLSAKIKHP